MWNMLYNNKKNTTEKDSNREQNLPPEVIKSITDQEMDKIIEKEMKEIYCKRLSKLLYDLSDYDKGK